jgi:uroporphyrinogen-III synthase
VAEIVSSPLAGKTVLVTRAAGQSAKLVEELAARQVKVKLLPLISFAPPENFDGLDAALIRLESFDWIVFTSANAVQAVEGRRQELAQGAIETLKMPRVAAVGPATADAAENAGYSVDYVAMEHRGTGLAKELKDELKGRRVFLPRSDKANPDLPEVLRRGGAVVTDVVAYKTLAAGETDKERVKDSIRDGVDGILFFSPSAVQNFLELLGRERLAALQGRAVMVAIGPTTAGALSAAGVQRIAWAADTTPKAVVEALEGHLSRTRKRSTVGAEKG